MLSRLAYLSQQKVTLRHWKDFGGFTGEEFTISMCKVFINRADLIVDLRINETLQTGAVRKPHLPGGESVLLFLEFTINGHVGLVEAEYIFQRPAQNSSSKPPKPIVGARETRPYDGILIRECRTRLK